ncbi:MAG: 2-hydroxyacyl-CoA dehydratase [Blautia sp.]|nr:2-hydroxyacyl-CoA dehydratase [Blautia sp.]
MPGIINEFGNYINHQAPMHPQRCRELLLMAYRAYGLKLRYFPEKRLPPSRQYAAVHMNHVVTKMLAHPEHAALVSIFMPCELLEVMDVIPMCAELYSAFLNGTYAESVFAQTAEDEGIPETYCSYHKILLGSAYTGMLSAPAFIVNTSHICDANNLTFRELADFYGIDQFYLDVPLARNEESVGYVAEQLRELPSFLEEHTGKKFDEEKLFRIMQRSQRTVQKLKQVLVEKKRAYLSGDVTSEMYEIYLAHNGLGSAASERYADLLLGDIRKAPKAEGLRLLWIHTIPNWQTPVREKLNFHKDCQIICCDMCVEGLTDVDPLHPYESMAKRLVYSPFNGGNSRVENSVKLAKELEVDGAVVFCHWGCKQTMGLSAALRQRLEIEGYPALVLNGDGCDRRNSSDGQTATRLDAFLEQLRQGGSKKHMIPEA